MDTKPNWSENGLIFSSDQRKFDVPELNFKHLEEFKEIRIEGPDFMIRQKSSQDRVDIKLLYDNNSILELLKKFDDEIMMNHFKFNKSKDFIKVLEKFEIDSDALKRSKDEEKASIKISSKSLIFSYFDVEIMNLEKMNESSDEKSYLNWFEDNLKLKW